MSTIVLDMWVGVDEIRCVPLLPLCLRTSVLYVRSGPPPLSCDHASHRSSSHVQGTLDPHC